MIDSKNLIALNKPNSYITESYKMLRTNINYLNTHGTNKVIMVTSSIAEEGKTTTISNLAVTMAKDGKKVLLIEGDLRLPRVHTVFKVEQSPGLTDIIYGRQDLASVVQSLSSVSNLHILTSGRIPMSASEFVNSDTFKELIINSRDAYDIILIDSPPVMRVTDAAIIAQMSDGVILTVAANQTKRALISKSIKTLESVDANIIGMIITKMSDKNRSAYYKDDYYTREQNKNKKSKGFLSKFRR